MGSKWAAGGGQLEFPDGRTGWLLLSLGEACTSQMPYVVYHTSDGGDHWSPRLVGPSACRGLHTPAGLLAAGGYPGGVSASGPRDAQLSLISPASTALCVLRTQDGG